MVRSAAVDDVEKSRIEVSGGDRSCCSILVHSVDLGLKAMEIAGACIPLGAARGLDLQLLRPRSVPTNAERLDKKKIGRVICGNFDANSF